MERQDGRTIWMVWMAIFFIFLPSAAHCLTVTHQYDNAGRLICAEYGSDKLITYTYDANGNLLQKIVATTYTLTVNNGTGTGEYEAGTVVDISADAPPAGQEFDAWTGDTAPVANVNSADTTVTMPAANVTVTATYRDLPVEQVTLTVEVSPVAGGSVTGSGIDCPGDCAQDYDVNTTVELTATPAAGMQFLQWEGALTGTTSPDSLLLDSDKQVIAYFGAAGGDTDADGLSDTAESGPHGDNPSYDGNGNGIPDYQEGGSASLPSAVGGVYVTLAVPNESGLVLSNVQGAGNPSPADAPEDVQFPYGFFHFTIDNLSAGACTTVTLFLPRNEAIYTYYKYGPTPDDPTDHWYEFLYDGQTGAEIFHEADRTRIVLHLCDGERGDNDLTVNGQIEDPGSPGIRASATIPAITEWGMLIFAFLMAVTAVVFMRRKNLQAFWILLVVVSLIVPAVCWGQWTNWGQINTDGFGNTNNFSAFSMAVYNNHLYVGTWNNSNGCQVWRRDGSSTGDWTQVNTTGFGSSNNRGAHCMVVYNNRLYVGTANNADGLEIWAYDGSSWTQVGSGGLGDSNNTWASAMVVHDNQLYLGTSWQAGVFTYDGSTWTQINVNGFGDSDNQAIRSLAVYDGKVYAGVYNTADYANLYRYDGPTTTDWTLVASGGFGGNFIDFRSLAAYDGKLFIGEAGWSVSCQVWEYDGTTFSRNDPGDAMKYDAARCMIVFQGKLYVGTGNDSGTPSGGQVWEYDGTAWDQVNDNGFGDTANQAVHSLTADGSSLFAGVANTAGDGGKVFGSTQAPIVTTQAVTGIYETTATGNGTITDLGYSNPTAHGVCWNVTGIPTIADNATDEGPAVATGAFTSALTGLTPNTTYYVRAYATNTTGTAYGDEVSFTTSPVAPTVTTQAVTNITTTTATGNGTITDLGSPNPTAHGVCWNTTGNPMPADNFTNEGAADATGPFTSNITGLTPNTTYYVRAYAFNTAGTTLGDQVSFSTTAILPSTYQVTYDGNGNTGGAVPVDASSPYAAGATVTVLGNTGSLVRDGFTFNGWNTAANGSGDSYAAGETFTMPAANVTLYAQWTAVSPAAIPTLSEWGMIIFALLMTGIAVVCIRRRQEVKSTLDS